MADKYQTIVKKVDYDLIEENNIERLQWEEAVIEAAGLLKQGEIVAIPTETVYGLAADASNPEAVKKIYRAKGRPQDNPLIVHISKRDQLDSLSTGKLSQDAEKLIDKFWPGPLTIIVNKNEKIPAETTAGLDSVAIRMPAHPLTLALLEALALPLAAPSANKSGAPSPTKAEHVLNDLNGRIAMILDGGPAAVGVESTVVDVREKPRILRPGGVSREEIEEVLAYKLLDHNSQKDSIVDNGLDDKEISIDKPLAPGMKYRHYSPETPLYIVEDKDELNRMIKKLSLQSRNKDKKIGLLLSTERYNQYNQNIEKEDLIVLKMGSRENPEEIASNLFSLLRSLDQLSLERVYIEAIPEKGIGAAVMNRLYKASSRK